MVDETSYLCRQLRVFYDEKSVIHETNSDSVIDWDDDWELYNQFSSQLSQESSNLIPYRNTNPYIMMSKKPDTLEIVSTVHNFDEMEFQQVIQEYDNAKNSKYLVLHMSVWFFEESNIGHSCLFIFCPRTKIQWFFEPYGRLDSILWKMWNARPLITGFTPMGICPCDEFQTKLECILGAKQDTFCGVICSMFNVQLALTHVEIEQLVRFWRVMVEVPLYWEQTKWFVSRFIVLYQQHFVEGTNNDVFL